MPNILRFFLGVKHILRRAIQGVFENRKIAITRLIRRFLDLPTSQGKSAVLEGFLKRFEGVNSAIFAISPTLNFPRFSLFGERSVYA
jgi:hypothetical protein